MSWTADTPTQGTYGSTAPFTVNHTCSANAKLLVVVVFINGTDARAGGALTYNSAPMTDSGQGFVFDTGGECGVEIWYLVDPDTGSSYTVSAPNTGSVNMDLSVMSFVPSAGGAAYDNSNSASGTTQNPSLSLTVSATGNLIVGGLGSGDRDVPTAGTNFTLIHTDDAGNQTWGSEYDLAGEASPVTVAFGTARGDDWGLIGISFAEAVGNINVSGISDAVTVGESVTIDPLVLADVVESDGVTVGESATLDILLEVSVSDGVSVADSASVDPILLEASASDGLAVADSPTLDPIVIDTLYVSDNVAVADVPNVAFGAAEDININVSDGITVSDAPSLDPVLIEASVADGASVSDSASLDPILLEALVSDGVTVAEDPTVVVESPVGGDLDINVSDGLTVADVAAVDQSFNLSVSDNVVVEDIVRYYPDDVFIGEYVELEIVGGTPDRSVSVSDSVSIGESVSLDIELDVSVSDGLTVGDSASVDLQVGVSESDGVAVGESTSVHVQAPWYNAEDLVVNTGSVVSGTVEDTWTDNGVKLQLAEVNGTPGFSYDFYFYDVPAIAADITFNGYYTGIAGHFKKIRQYNFTTTGWTDLTPDLDDFPPAGADYTVQFPLLNDADYNSGGEIRLRIIHTSGGNAAHYLFIDQLLLGTNFAIHVNDNTNVGDSAAVNVQVEVSASDDLTIGESAISDLQIDVFSQESATVSDVVNIVLPDALKISVSESLTVDDSTTVIVQEEGVRYVVASDNTTVGESVNVSVSEPQADVSDNVAVGDTAQANIELGVVATDNVAIGDTAQAIVSDLLINVSDGVSVADSPTVIVQAEEFKYVIASDSVSVGDSATVSVSDPQVSATDNVAIGESVSITVTEAGAINISVSDGVTVADSATASTGDLQVIASESVGIGESAIVQIGGVTPVQISVSDSVVVADAVNALLDLNISEQDSVIITDGATVIVFPIHINVSDGLTLGETINVVSVEIAWVEIRDYEISGVNVSNTELHNVGISDTNAYNVTVGDYE